MSSLDEEIGFQKGQGMALAGRFPNCRVYRGCGTTKVIGRAIDEDEVASVDKLISLIEKLGGHKSNQVKTRRRPLARV